MNNWKVKSKANATFSSFKTTVTFALETWQLTLDVKLGLTTQSSWLQPWSLVARYSSNFVFINHQSIRKTFKLTFGNIFRGSWSSRLQVLFKIGVLKIFTKKPACVGPIFGLITLLKRDSKTGVFLWNWWNFSWLLLPTQNCCIKKPNPKI